MGPPRTSLASSPKLSTSTFWPHLKPRAHPSPASLLLCTLTQSMLMQRCAHRMRKPRLQLRTYCSEGPKNNWASNRLLLTIRLVPQSKREPAFQQSGTSKDVADVTAPSQSLGPPRTEPAPAQTAGAWRGGLGVASAEGVRLHGAVTQSAPSGGCVRDLCSLRIRFPRLRRREAESQVNLRRTET